MISFRRCAALLAVALVLSACLTGCSKGDGYVKSFEMAATKRDKCATAAQARDAYLEERNETLYQRWAITADLECTEYAMGYY